MNDVTALWVAIDLVRVPSRVRGVRAASLPQHVDAVLRIAAGDEALEIEAARIMEVSRQQVRKASAFFIEQILLHPEADSYRVLGADPHASATELRRNMALLLRWLHPDIARNGERSIFATRVTKAWEEVKTPVRRAEHDAAELAIRKNQGLVRRSKDAKFRSRGKAVGKRIVRVPVSKKPGLVQRMLRFLLKRTKR
jgi:hypothetical protein